MFIFFCFRERDGYWNGYQWVKCWIKGRLPKPRPRTKVCVVANFTAAYSPSWIWIMICQLRLMICLSRLLSLQSIERNFQSIYILVFTIVIKLCGGEYIEKCPRALLPPFLPQSLLSFLWSLILFRIIFPTFKAVDRLWFTCHYSLMITK